jgi:hypothetical protein
VGGKSTTLSGTLGTGQTGAPAPDRSITVFGNSAQGTVGTFHYRYWTVVNDSQTPNWVVVSTE